MNIILPKDSGFVAVGAYQAGTVYHVEDQEAQRLIDVKGFRVATAEESGEGIEVLGVADETTDEPATPIMDRWDAE